MITLRITEFSGYGLEEFVLFLKEGDDNIYEIVIPKETTIGSSTRNEIALEFFTAAYIGQSLNEISSEFFYVCAEPERIGEFGFNIQTTMVEKLADLLFAASGSFGNPEVADPLNFSIAVGAFVTKYKTKGVACQDMFTIGKEYHSGELE